MKRLTIAVVLLMVMTSTAFAQDPTAEEYVPGDYVGSVVVDNFLRGYLMHIPLGYDGSTPYPLILSYHGFTADPVQNAERTGLSEKADEEGFIVVYPAGQREPMGWFTQPGAVEAGWLDDVAFTGRLLDKLQEDLNIDPRRIYLTGFSNGGGMIHRLACDFSDTVAAIAPVAGPHFVGDPCDIERPIPVLALHGRLDTNAKYDGYYDLLIAIPDWAQLWAERNGCELEPELTTPEEDVTVQTWSGCDEGAEVILRTYERGRHVWPDGAEDMIWDFFEAHPMPEAAE